MIRDFEYVTGLLEDGSEADLDELSSLLEDFPEGTDDFLGRRWIMNAIDCGSRRSIEWMVSKRVDLSFVDEEGYSPLLSVIESRREDKYEILKLLLQHGASTSEHGVNDWTPLHLTAARNDVESLKLLVSFRADTSVRTRIDDHATPMEEARILGCEEAVAFLEGVV